MLVHSGKRIISSDAVSSGGFHMAAKNREGLSVNETAQRLGVGVGFAYLLVRSAQVKAIRIDGRWRVDPASIEERLKRLSARRASKPAQAAAVAGRSL